MGGAEMKITAAPVNPASLGANLLNCKAILSVDRRALKPSCLYWEPDWRALSQMCGREKQTMWVEDGGGQAMVGTTDFYWTIIAPVPKPIWAFCFSATIKLLTALSLQGGSIEIEREDKGKSDIHLTQSLQSLYR